jgi:tRNA dimethylallyltransferase
MTSSGADAPLAICLMGPTATGKTEVAVELARHLPLGLISVDSALVYRGLDIGTAKPAPELLAEVPHRLVDIVEPEDAYSAARFRTDALEAMAAVRAEGRVPLLVGGTGLYFRALEQGLAELPAADPALRRRLAEEARTRGWAALHGRLAQADPASAARIHPNDPQRIQRALEVLELSGRPLSELLAAGRAGRASLRLLKLALAPPDRTMLHERIEARFRAMLRRGLVEEVEGLRRRPRLRREHPSMRAVGYRQVWDFLAGCYDYEDMTRRGVTATRQLAKRQLTWLRREQGLTWHDAGAASGRRAIRERVEAALGQDS